MAQLAPLFQTFAVNLALVIVLSFGVGAVTRYFGVRWRRGLAVANGALFALLAILCMIFPMELVPGVLADQRNLVVFFAGVFGGPVTAAIASAAAGLFRLHIGGIGAFAGIGGILTSALFGVLVARWWGRLDSAFKAAVAGLIVLAATLPWFLVIDGIDFGLSLIAQIALPFAIFYVGASVVLAWLLTADRRRRETEARLLASEERFRDITDLATDWFWETDEDHRYTYISPRFETITGRPIADILGKRRAEFVEEVSDQALQEYRAAIDRREAFHNFTYAFEVPNGRHHYIMVSGKPIFDSASQFLGYRRSGRDISAAVQAERDLIAAKAAAERANLSKSEFLASMSHELRTPLNAVIGFSDLMKQELYGPHAIPVYKEYAGYILNSGRHLLDLINDILDISKIEAGKLDLLIEECDLDEIVGSAIRFVEERASHAEVTIRFTPASGPSTALVDERAIRQTVLNILGNAVKYSRPGGVVRIAVAGDCTGGHVITIEDDGVGIPKSDFEKIFEPFEQAANTRVATEGGTGLGLPISKALVEAHCGRLELSSQEDVGTTVNIHLPATQKNTANP
ncbi:MAG: ATP-binding protein [Proteobacteria bacterium]|nr:ATP-binding protein [Pseudomonadota bacterium]